MFISLLLIAVAADLNLSGCVALLFQTAMVSKGFVLQFDFGHSQHDIAVKEEGVGFQFRYPYQASVHIMDGFLWIWILPVVCSLQSCQMDILSPLLIASHQATYPAWQVLLPPHKMSAAQ